jgi:ACS family hexuronate transporter-like MFS transporter
MALCSLLSFIDRQVLAVLSPTILKDTGLTAADFGWVVSFFFWAYTLANPIWGSVIDRIGVRIGMIMAVTLWSIASGAHAFMASAVGFAAARLVLGLGEGATFPGGLRTATECLPPQLRGRAAAISFSGGTIGAIITPLFIVPFGLTYGWRAAFILSGVIGIVWVVFWAAIARPPYLPETKRSAKIGWPNFLERRVWALMFSYGPTAISVGPILTLVQLYLNKGLHVSQGDIGKIFWIPPLGWMIGYYVGGWAADRYASDNPRPVGLMVLCTVLALPLGFTAWTSSVGLAIALISFSAFMAGVFQMVGLKVAAHHFPREKTAMMSGIASGTWSALNALISPSIGRMFGAGQYNEAFWIVALFPVVGTIGWIILSQQRSETAPSYSSATATS